MHPSNPARPQRRGALVRVALLAVPLLASGCSWLWPSMVRTEPRGDVFHSGFPLVGAARTDGALCSLAAVGPAAVELVSPPEALDAAVELGDWCAGGEPARAGQRGRVGRLVVVGERAGAGGDAGAPHGYLYPLPAARGLLIAFSGLGMPASGWITERLAELAARRGLATFAPVRDERARPIAFDPLREARRALRAGRRIQARCGIREPLVVFVGLSMGGMEALLANREARASGLASRAAVLDPLLDPAKVTAHLDGFWHSLAADSMQAYFRRILRGRYGEPASTSFRELLGRARPDAETVPERDAPRAWLCQADPDAHAVFLSEDDPVLGVEQADFARRCGFPLRPARVPGHIGVACRPELLDELLDALRLPPPEAEAGPVTGTPSG